MAPGASGLVSPPSSPCGRRTKAKASVSSVSLLRNGVNGGGREAVSCRLGGGIRTSDNKSTSSRVGLGNNGTRTALTKKNRWEAATPCSPPSTSLKTRIHTPTKRHVARAVFSFEGAALSLNNTASEPSSQSSDITQPPQRSRFAGQQVPRRAVSPARGRVAIRDKGGVRPSRATTKPHEASEALGLPLELSEAIEKFLNQNTIVAFIKGTKAKPACGFSNTVVQVLNALDVPYETVNVLEDETLKHGLKVYSRWPTFPQVYIDGEFVGGADIALDLYKSGELAEIIERAQLS